MSKLISKINQTLNDSYMDQKDKSTVILTGTDITKRIMDLIKETCERVIGKDEIEPDKWDEYNATHISIATENDTKKEQRARLKKELNDK